MPRQRFSTFSFVDRITSFDSSGLIRGVLQIPLHFEHFSYSLIAEAIGQLAAWSAMSTLDFCYRPVAALAGKVRYYSQARPGETLVLIARIENCDTDSVSYSGAAFIEERLVLELNDCSGAMLPQSEFDDPKIVKEHFQLLTTDGAKENRMTIVPYISPNEINFNTKGILEGNLYVPSRADFFADHFPRKPVLPATLLIHALSEMVVNQKNDSLNKYPIPTIASVAKVKIRSWILPGDQVSLRAEGLSTRAQSQPIKLSAHLGNRLVASAMLNLEPETSSRLT